MAKRNFGSFQMKRIDYEVTEVSRESKKRNAFDHDGHIIRMRREMMTGLKYVARAMLRRCAADPEVANDPS